MAANPILSLSAGLLLRLAIPVIVTLSLVFLLRSLDQHWQQESLREALGARGGTLTLEKAHCWEIFDCSPEKRGGCSAFRNPDKPCWEAISPDGNLMECCGRCPLRATRLAGKPA